MRIYLGTSVVEPLSVANLLGMLSTGADRQKDMVDDDCVMNLARIPPALALDSWALWILDVMMTPHEC